MEIGTGIFLGCAFIGLVVLYVYTRDRWKWKRIAAWTLATFAVSIGGFGGWLWYSDREATTVDAPQAMESFWDLGLGMPESEVRFRKGEPLNPKEESWYFKQNENLYYVVGFRDGRVRFVVADSGNRVYLPELRGVSTYATQEELERRFGAPSHVDVSKDGLQRRINFSKYNLIVEMEKNAITAYGMYDGTGEPMRFIGDDTSR